MSDREGVITEAWRDYSGGMSTEEFPAVWHAFRAGWDAREQRRIDESRAFVVEWERKQDELHGDYE